MRKLLFAVPLLLLFACEGFKSSKPKPGFVIAGRVANYGEPKAYLYRSSETTFSEDTSGLIYTADIDPDGYFYINTTADKPDFYKLRIGERDYIFDYEDDLYIQLYDTIAFEADMNRNQRSVTFKGVNALINQFTWDLYQFVYDREYRFNLQPEYAELTPLKFAAYNNELMADKFKFYKGYFTGRNENLEQKRYLLNKVIYQTANNVYTFLATTTLRQKYGVRYLNTEFSHFKIKEKVDISNDNFTFLFPYREFVNHYLNHLYELAEPETSNEEKDERKFSVKARLIREHFEHLTIRDIALTYLVREVEKSGLKEGDKALLEEILLETAERNSGTVYYRYFIAKATGLMAGKKTELP